ncbi:uncharacterized protein LOC106644859 [Copidosoma floridanum]|uniref:uncharacterized protein LOC106644859 n=1 Tax=Copidosoma floridanum TaxID=29053 RepID=UPI0006C98C5B|nr:uncharacterized protein LOC106644859 [Copidosoma floridanum]
MTEANSKICTFCKSTSFYTESGFFYCTQCLTQNEDANEQVFEAQYDTNTRFRTTKIQKRKVEDTDVIGWTSWELYNFALLKMTNELIEIGADPAIKLTVFQLWTYYLTKLEVAFTSKTKKLIPKMSRQFRKKDAEIIYGKVKKSKKKRRRKSVASSNTSLLSTSITSVGSASRRSFLNSQRLLIKDHNQLAKEQQSTDAEANSSMNQSLDSLQSSFSKASSNAVRIRFNKRARLEAKKAKEKAKKVPRGVKEYIKKNYVSDSYSYGPDVLTPFRLWCVAFLALRIHNQKIYASDMLRFGRENHLTYYKLHNAIPPEVALAKDDLICLTPSSDITHKGLRTLSAKMARFLGIEKLPKPDIVGLIRRYCEDLELPKGVILYAERLYLSSPCIMDYTKKSLVIPNYEGRAMAFIIVVLKTLFGLDDITEKEISRVVDKINRSAAERDILEAKLFSFGEWQEFIECRKAILASIHFPSKVKYDPENMNRSHLYLRFMTLMDQRFNTIPPELDKGKNVVTSTAMADIMRQCVNDLSNCNNDAKIEPLKEMMTFPASLTPLKFYIAQLAEDSHIDVPYVLQTKFHDTKVGYMTKPEKLVELASHCDVSLKVVESSLHYLEKIVPPYKRIISPTVKELCEFVEVKASSDKQHFEKNSSDNFLDYVHRKRECKFKVNSQNLRYYSVVHEKELKYKEASDFEEDSSFNKILPDGRLDIKDGSDSEDENPVDQLTLGIRKIELYNHELTALNNTEKKDEIEKLTCEISKRFVKAFHGQKENKRITLPSDDSSRVELKANNKSKVTQKIGENKTMDSSQSKSKDEDECVYISESTVKEDVAIINQTKSNNKNPTLDDEEILFRPYKDYWMQYCDQAIVNFDLVEKELPKNFLWLLNECADMVEMTTEELYLEVCVVESFHLTILKTSKSEKDGADYPFHDTNSSKYKNYVTKEWL